VAFFVKIREFGDFVEWKMSLKYMIPFIYSGKLTESIIEPTNPALFLIEKLKDKKILSFSLMRLIM
jgi:hypothetical protein